ncbi:MAG: hypothetical protein LBB58_04605 [Cellulomonadaceae bacterium]|jgi:hypothetical protein|nr:hypothetical protein [Cellulomonadaceae bacterium]
MANKANTEVPWYQHAPKWDEIIHAERGTPISETAPLHIVKPESGAIAIVTNPHAHTAPRHTRRDMLSTITR